jgi:hypothetical protein
MLNRQNLACTWKPQGNVVSYLWDWEMMPLQCITHASCACLNCSKCSMIVLLCACFSSFLAEPSDLGCQWRSFSQSFSLAEHGDGHHFLCGSMCDRHAPLRNGNGDGHHEILVCRITHTCTMFLCYQVISTLCPLEHIPITTPLIYVRLISQLIPQCAYVCACRTPSMSVCFFVKF